MGGHDTCRECGASIADGNQFCNKCGAMVVTQAADDPLIGRSIADKYAISSLLGSGAMGKIYLAEHTALQRTVALKVLHPHLTYNESLVHRFLREARAASRLSHPNIVTLLDFGQDPEDGLLYLVMEFLEGESLQTIIERGPLGLDRALDLAQQILLAIDEAHAQGIVHRDLKPENIIVLPTRRGEQVKVVDFGLAQLVGTDDPRLTSTGLVCGTPSYISPEQARASDVGPLADIYSFGVILYELVTGKLPFEATGAYEMVSKHLTEQPIPPADRAPERALPAPLCAVIMRCLEKSPEQRMSGAAEVLDALQAITPGRGPSITPVPVGPAAVAPTAGPESRDCPACGASMPRQARYCGGCGADMEGDPAAPASRPAKDATLAPEPAPRDEERLRRFVPPLVLEALLHSGGPADQLTMLFGEIEGASAAVEDSRAGTGCIDVLISAAERHGGTADKFVGDSVVAVFGAPVPDPNAPQHALDAAGAMQAALDQLNRDLPRALSLRVGLHASAPGTAPDHDTVGQLVRMAQRLQTVADPGTILVSGEVQRACAATHSFTPRPELEPTLGPDATTVHEVVVEAGPAAEQEKAEPLPSTFLVGRTRERAHIEGAARSAVAGRGAAVLVTGEPGIGKSALLLHAAQSLRALGLETFLVRARSRASVGPGAMGHMLRSLLGCPPDATEGQVQGRLQNVEGLDATDRSALAFLAHTVRSSASLPALALELTCVTALRRLLRHVGRSRPSAILLDNGDHIGTRERSLLCQVVETFLEQPLLLVVAQRESDQALLDAGMAPLPLDPLTARDGERLLRKLARGKDVDAETVQRVLESSGGNPLYLVETIRYLERGGHLVPPGPGGRRRTGEIAIPGNLRALVLSRFDELDPLAKTALVHAALVGRAFSPTLLLRLLPDKRGLQTTLEELEELGLLEQDEDSSTARLQFRHELVREILCETLTPDKRRAVHGRIAELLLDGAAPDTPAEEIGRQLELAGRTADAAGQYELAANDYKDRGEPAEAAGYLRRALAVLRHDGDNGGSPRSMDLRIHLARLLNRASLWDEAHAIALEARNQALPTGDVILATRASQELARAAAELGDLQLADSVLSEAYQTACECGELDLAAALASALGEVQERKGQLDQALRTLEEARRRLEAASRRTRISQAGAAAGRVAEVLSRLGRVLVRLDRPAEAIQHLEKALKHLHIAGDPLLEGQVLNNLGQARAATGDPVTALTTLQEALAALQRAGDRVGSAKLLHRMARLHLESGERDRAQALARESFELSTEIGWSEGETMGAALLEQLG